MSAVKKQTSPLLGLEFTQLDSKWLRRYASPIKTVGESGDGTGKVWVTQRLAKGTCQVVAGLGIYKDSLTDAELDNEFQDFILVRKSELIRFLGSKKQKK